MSGTPRAQRPQRPLLPWFHHVTTPKPQDSFPSPGLLKLGQGPVGDYWCLTRGLGEAGPIDLMSALA